MAGEGKEIIETVTSPDCKDDVEDDDGIADAPPVPPHNEAYGHIDKLAIVGGTTLLWSSSSVASPQAAAERGDEVIYKTYAATHSKLILFTNVATQHARGYRSFDIIMNNQIP